MLFSQSNNKYIYILGKKKKKTDDLSYKGHKLTKEESKEVVFIGVLDHLHHQEMVAWRKKQGESQDHGV